MRPKLATHLSPEEVVTLNVTSRSVAALNVTSTTQRHAAAPVTLLAPEVDEAGSLSECEAKFAASCAGQATCCYLCFPDGTPPCPPRRCNVPTIPCHLCNFGIALLLCNRFTAKAPPQRTSVFIHMRYM